MSIKLRQKSGQRIFTYSIALAGNMKRDMLQFGERLAHKQLKEEMQINSSSK